MSGEPLDPSVARELKQCHQPALPARIAVNIALRHLDRLMPGEQLNVAQGAAGLMRISRRRSKRRFDTRDGAPATGAEPRQLKQVTPSSPRAAQPGALAI